MTVTFRLPYGYIDGQYTTHRIRVCCADWYGKFRARWPSAVIVSARGKTTAARCEVC